MGDISSEGRQAAAGTALRELRSKANLTQTELAQRCGVSERSIRELERGKVAPRPATLRALCVGLGLDAKRTRELLGPFVPPSVVALAEVLDAPLLILQQELSTLNENAAYSDCWTSYFHHTHQIVGPDGHFELSRTQRGITSTVESLTHRICVTSYEPPLAHSPDLTADFGCRVSQQWTLADYNLTVHELELGRALGAGDSISYGYTADDSPDPQIRDSLERPSEVSEGSRGSVETFILDVQFTGPVPGTICPFQMDGAHGERRTGPPIKADSTGTVHLEVRNTPPGRGYGFSWVW